MSAHTSGPWAALPEECDKPYIRIRGTIPGGRYKVANVLTPVYDGVDVREAAETRANARLIAAAPDLLEQLQLMVQQFAQYVPAAPNGGNEAWRISKARAAIAKATGSAA